jgi:cytochrome c553
MPRFGVLLVASISLWAVGASFAADLPPSWAYGYTEPPLPPGQPPRSAGRGRGPAPAQTAGRDESLLHLEGSDRAFTYSELWTHWPPGPGDWFPHDHPKMPDIVAQGRRPDVDACGSCHYPNGKGKSENAGVAGYSVEYFIQTMHDFRDGLRHSADPRKANTNTMSRIAKGITEEELKAAAEYFASMKWTPWIKVIEADLVPKSRAQGGLFLTLEGNEKEPLGNRILETPVNTEQTEIYKNPRAGFLAYVPAGSLKKGEVLVKTGAGKTIACGMCHGPDLRGTGPVPSLAGRSPSYEMRQLWDMQQGTRKGTWTELMKPVIAHLSVDDMTAIVAYTASLAP